MNNQPWRMSVSIPVMHFRVHDRELDAPKSLALRADLIESYESIGESQTYVRMCSGDQHTIPLPYDRFTKSYNAAMSGKEEIE